jgi:hypothetical protein
MNILGKHISGDRVDACESKHPLRRRLSGTPPAPVIGGLRAPLGERRAAAIWGDAPPSWRERFRTAQRDSVRGERIKEITAFAMPELFAYFGLPSELAP